MSEQWLKDYALLALRIDKVMRTLTDLPYVDGYYGPPVWKAQVESEPDMGAGELTRAAMALADALPAQDFEPHRAACLAKQVVAMEAVCRRLSGETLSLQDEVRRCFDVQAAWIPVREGRPDEEVQDYLVKYLQPASSVEHLKKPFHDIYLCTYYYGKQLLAPLLHGLQRQFAFRRALTEQLIPSDLV